MTSRFKITFPWQLLAGVAFVSIFAVVILTRPNHPPSYLDFVDRDSAFYASFANACDQVIQNNRSNISQRLRIDGTNLTLPPLIKHVMPSYVDVDSNRVYLLIDVPASYGISWLHDGYNPQMWRLIVFGDADPLTVYIRTNSFK
jgi:hypothetical protein